MGAWRNSGVWVVLVLAAPAASAQTHSLIDAPRPGDCYKYDLSMTLKGEIRVNRDGRTVAIPITATADHNFRERILEAKEKSLPEKVARHYGMAKSSVTVDGSTNGRAIRDDRRLIVAQRHKDQFLAYSPAGPMTHEELDVVSEHFDTLALSGVLPREAVSIGDTWKLGNDVAQALCQFE